MISAVAERLRERIRGMVYLDAFVPEDGTRVVYYLLPIERRDAMIKVGNQSGFVPPVPLTALGVSDERDLEWATARLTPQPFATMNEPIKLARPAADGLPRAFIACSKPASRSFTQFADRVRHDPTWDFHNLATGLDAMITALEALARAILNLGWHEGSLAQRGTEGV